MLFNYILVFFIALILNLIIIPIIIRFSHKKGWYDQPDHRTVHTIPTPRLGGVGIYWSFILSLVGIIIFLAVLNQLEGLLEGSLAPILVLLALLAVHITGLVDDFKDMRAMIKFFLQFVAAFIVIAAGFYFRDFVVPFTGDKISLGPLGPVITLIWIVAIGNAVNLIDGLDGLAGGVAGIAIAFLGIFYALKGEVFPALLAFSALGAILGFLWYNKPKASIFMGDSGSLVLGFLVAILPLMGEKTNLFSYSWFLPLTVILIPVADTIGAIVRRLRDGRPIFSPDKEHMHHKLLALGLSNTSILIVVYLLAVILGLPLMIAGIQGRFGFLGTIVLDVAPLVSILVMILFFTWLHFAFKKTKLKKNCEKQNEERL